MEFLDKYSGIIALIILIVCLVAFVRYRTNHEDDEKEQVEEVSRHVERYPLNLEDEDATVAALIASIDYRNEVKKDVRVVSVREVR